MRLNRFAARAMLPALMPLAVTGCVGSPVISAPKAPCSSLIPDSWRTPVANAPAPESSADPLVALKNWITFGTAQTGQLSKANGRAEDSIGIVGRCERRDAESIERSRPRFLGIF